MQTKGVLVVVSGFSGAGKGTVMKALLNKYDNYALSVSATTRNPRPGEENGREYFFLTESQFEDMIKNDELIEHARYVDHYYGTPKKYVEEKMAAGKDVILEIDQEEIPRRASRIYRTADCGGPEKTSYRPRN